MPSPGANVAGPISSKNTNGPTMRFFAKWQDARDLKSAQILLASVYDDVGLGHGLLLYRGVAAWARRPIE